MPTTSLFGLLVTLRRMVTRRQQPVRSRKTSEIVARRIVETIERQQLKPGDVLPQEAMMQEQYGVGRSTLREGLRLLETQGVLELKAGRGPSVRQPTPADLVNSMTLLLQFHGATFETLLRARAMFEPAIAAEAARVARPIDIEDLRETVAAARRAGNHFEELVLSELEFHRHVAAICGNPFANVVTESLIAALTIDLSDIPQGYDVEHDIEQHERLIDALAARDSDKAEAIMRVHIMELIDVARTVPALLRRPVRWI